MPTLQFTVDAALLRELGERLVGKPHIALAELIKNSYDADATHVEVRFEDDEITVVDDGHGMNFQEFRDFWMRIGTPHKQKEGFSKKFKRPVTGSKGVGRLAVQFLGRRLQLKTVSDGNTRSELVSNVDWEKAVKAGELTKAEAEYEQTNASAKFTKDSGHGTRLLISKLNHEWTPEEFKALAQNIWWLQPPFRKNQASGSESPGAFEVEVKSVNSNVVQEFDRQMRAYLDIWHARLVGRLTGPPRRGKNKPGEVVLSLDFADGAHVSQEYEIPDCKLQAAEFEIRVFHLKYKQPSGIRVDEIREYLNRFGGVHVYDSGFHLPYYGPDTDWLKIEIDHSHRLSRSKLLPPELQVPEGMNYLPTQSRLLGVVHVNTSQERETALQYDPTTNEYLQIQVTRDRLTDNKALENLQDAVRWALDFYSMQEAARATRESESKRDVEPVSQKIDRIEEIIERHRADLPRPVFLTIRKQVQAAVRASEAEAEILTRRAGLLGALATAGISAVAFEHEVTKQFHLLEQMTKRLKSVRVNEGAARDSLNEVTSELDEWLDRVRHTYALFAHLKDEANREIAARLLARELLQRVADQVEVFTRGTSIEAGGVDDSLRLPKGSFSEWSAVFQNVYINAFNALLDTRKKRISVSSKIAGKNRAILVQDNGSGIDLSTADKLFEPFVRKMKVSAERRSLGLGGMGLGLTIVRMIATALHCRVRFVKPAHGFNTAFELSWSEEE
jgi:signal transduction histidine kinase